MRKPKEKLQPTTFVIFGVTGDLAQKKLIPALFHLWKEKHLPPLFRIVGFSRRDWSKKQFDAFVKPLIKKSYPRVSKKMCEDFLSHCSFSGGTFDTPESYDQLHTHLEQSDIELKVCTNKLFYLAVPPKYYETIFKKLSSSGLMEPCSGPIGWTRIVVEKPFGKDLRTAQALDKLLGKLYKEEQIFRIDHYLAKETLQNILAFRFSNVLFEPIWNNQYVEKIDVRIHEKMGIEGRGDFYDDIGALRDVGQNHLLQMLALVTMEDPMKLDAEAIRTERARVLQALEIIKSKQLPERVQRGQFKNYTKIADVPARSKTETSFNIEARINTKRWKGVPIHLSGGKAFPKDDTSITIYFKEKPTCVCEIDDDQELKNVLTFHVKPREGIEIQFWANKPGFGMQVETRELSFDYPKHAIQDHMHDAYERVLYDVVRGDQTLFASTQEIQAAWRFITPILENWHNLPLTKY